MDTVSLSLLNKTEDFLECDFFHQTSRLWCRSHSPVNGCKCIYVVCISIDQSEYYFSLNFKGCQLFICRRSNGIYFCCCRSCCWIVWYWPWCTGKCGYWTGTEASEDGRDTLGCRCCDASRFALATHRWCKVDRRPLIMVTFGPSLDPARSPLDGTRVALGVHTTGVHTTRSIWEVNEPRCKSITISNPPIAWLRMYSVERATDDVGDYPGEGDWLGVCGSVWF